MPASVDVGADLLPYVKDPTAVDAQTVCPGYKASQVEETDSGLTAILTLAGAPCNVYGNDVKVLKLEVEYQSANRLAISISPTNIVSQKTYSKEVRLTSIRMRLTHRGTSFPKS